MSHVLDLRGLIKLCMMSHDILLPVLSGVPVLGWGWPMASRVRRIGIASFALTKVPLVSASADEETTFLIVFHNVYIGPFGGGESRSELVR